jgi:hypothetical protein
MTTSSTPATKSGPLAHAPQASRAPLATPDAPTSQTAHANPTALAGPTPLTAVAAPAAPTAPPVHSPVIPSHAHPPPELAAAATLPTACPRAGWPLVHHSPPTQQIKTDGSSYTAATSGPSAPGLPVDACRSAGAEGRRQALDCAFTILGLPRVDGPVTAQMTLPLRHGGLGLSCTSPAEGSAAYLAAAATTHQAMLNGPEAFRPFNGPSGVQLRTQWASLHYRACTLWPPEYQEVSLESLGTIAAAQCELSGHMAQT